MSHHFDSRLARKDPRLNVCDVYLFRSGPGRTAMILTSNADAAISGPDTFHPEAVYAFRFDTDGDAHEDVVFEVRFGEVEPDGTQSCRVDRSANARAGLLTGRTGGTWEEAGVKAYAGLVPDMWAADAWAIIGMENAFYFENRFEASVFEHRRNFFERRNAVAIVLEVPDELIGAGLVHVWGTISLVGHAPETQVSRWGFPLFTHLFFSAWRTRLTEQYHTTVPAQDAELFGRPIARFVAGLALAAGATADPDRYGAAVAARVCPSMLPYHLGTEPEFTVDRFNGRPLHVDGYDVMVSLAAGRPVADGVAPDPDRYTDTFPFYGPPFTAEEQQGLRGIPQHGVTLD